MKTKYIINKNEIIVNLNFFYEFLDNQNKIDNIRNYINNLLIDNNINFKGNRIIVYKNGLLIGTFYLTNYYLNKIFITKNNNYLTDINSYFEEKKYYEINKKIKFKKILSI